VLSLEALVFLHREKASQMEIAGSPQPCNPSYLPSLEPQLHIFLDLVKDLLLVSLLLYQESNVNLTGLSVQSHIPGSSEVH
jgi:hypothetical protein